MQQITKNKTDCKSAIYENASIIMSDNKPFLTDFKPFSIRNHIILHLISYQK
jgi:hypothetical protein